VPVPDDKFEIYLRQFSPCQPEPLPIKPRVYTHWATRGKTIFTTGMAIAAVVVVAILLTYPRTNHFQQSEGGLSTNATHIEVARPLTIRSANTILGEAPSFKAAIDGIAFSRPATQLPKEMHSALSVLSKEPQL
jgi:hypothetical protein